MAATAASHILGTPLVAPTAADRLVPWLQKQFGSSAEFKARVVCRMVGQPYRHHHDSRDLQPKLRPSAEEQLRKALDFDDSLFAAEEQNLFLDEVRETARWRGGAFQGLRFRRLPGSDDKNGDEGGDDDKALGCLKTWVEAGLRCLIGLVVAEREDGPLGWTSDQHVFAVCARILLCAVAITRAAGEGAGEGTVGLLLGEFREVGEKGRIHGSLLEMARSSEAEA